MSRRVVIRPAIVYDAQGILKTHSAAVHRTASRRYASDILTAWAAPFDADSVRRMAGIIASQSELVLVADPVATQTSFGRRSSSASSMSSKRLAGRGPGEPEPSSKTSASRTGMARQRSSCPVEAARWPAARIAAASHHVEHVADDRRKQLVTQAREQRIVVHLGHIHCSLDWRGHSARSSRHIPSNFDLPSPSVIEASRRLAARARRASPRRSTPAPLSGRGSRQQSLRRLQPQQQTQGDPRPRGDNRSIIGPVPLLFAGPPWRVDFYSDKGLDRTPDLRYPDTADDEISLWQGCV